MFCPSIPDRLRRLALLLVLICPLAFATSSQVQSFTAATWDELLATRNGPLVVVFSTTDCTHCPKAIDQIAATLGRKGRRARLAVVVMDGAEQEGVWQSEPWYRRADHLYAFDGSAAAIRHRVNPAWRGITPYVVLLPATGVPQFFNGAPPAATLRNFLATEQAR